MPFYTFLQNNSGGYFINNEDVAEAVIIEAPSLDDAVYRMEEITESYDEYCECCGTRWSDYPSDEVTVEPLIFGDPAIESGYSSVVYYEDGTVKHLNKEDGDEDDIY